MSLDVEQKLSISDKKSPHRWGLRLFTYSFRYLVNPRRAFPSPMATRLGCDV